MIIPNKIIPQFEEKKQITAQSQFFSKRFAIFQKALLLSSLALASLACVAQNHTPRYFSLAKNRVYDIEIILFAYKKQLPNAETYSNKPIFDTANALNLATKPANLPLTKPSDSNSNDEYTIAIDKNRSQLNVLAWFEHDSSFFQLNAVWKKLKNAPDTIPLIHKAWRQPQTPFKKPQYVKISNQQADSMPLPDLSVIGQVAFSKGRFLHFGHQVNLIRNYYDSNNNPQNMVFAITQRKQIKTNEIHYFDSPWFGSIVKITEVTGK